MSFSHQDATDASDNTVIVIQQGADALSARVQSSAVAGTEVGVVTRNIPGGNQHVNLRDSSDVESGTLTNPIRVSPADVGPATQNITVRDIATTTVVGANSQNFYIGSPTANSAASFTLSSMRAASVQASLIGAGGTMVIEVSSDGGTLWTRPSVHQQGTTNYTNSFASGFNATVNVTGMTNIRVRGISAWTGTATITVKESSNHGAVSVIESALPIGAATSALQTQPGVDIGDVTVNNASGASAVNIQDGGNSITIDAASLPLPTGASTSALQTTGNTSLSSIDGKVPANLTVTSTRLLTDGSGVTQPISASSLPLPTGASTSANQTSGAQKTQLSDSSLSSYWAFASYNPAVTATDTFTITGSATKTVKIRRLIISGTNTANTNALILLIKRSAANTGGTSATLTAVAADSTNSAATATIRNYTANPTLGTVVGTIAGRVIFLPLLASANSSISPEWNLIPLVGQPITVRGTAEVVSVNLNAVNLGILSATSLNIAVEWTEE